MSNRSEPAAVTPGLLVEWGLPDPGDSKKARGRACVVGGSARSPGAVLLAGEAALRVGAGLATLFVPAEVAPGLAVAFPEAGVVAWTDGLRDGLPGAAAGELGRAQAVLVGPGFDDAEETEARLRTVAAAADVPMLLDAFALGILPRLDRGVLPRELVLTPNREEAAILLGEQEEEADADAVREIARRFDAVVCCYGVIAAPDGAAWRVHGGGPGLGSSGSGDVRSGAITGLLARGVEPVRAAVWGTWLHTRAGNRLAAQRGLGFLARELAAELPVALREIVAP